MPIESRQYSAHQVLMVSPLIPVVVLDTLEDALPLAEALLNGGIRIMEITLRTAIALRAIEAVRVQLPDMLVGAGTISRTTQLTESHNAGAQFAFSPGLTKTLLRAGQRSLIPFIPGASTLSDLMLGIEQGYHCFKFFPAERAGGSPMLKAISGPFPDLVFCPTGGIEVNNCLQYLALANVPCIGGSWVVPASMLRDKDWGGISRLCREALEIIGG